jgi:hypothetical protein
LYVNAENYGQKPRLRHGKRDLRACTTLRADVRKIADVYKKFDINAEAVVRAARQTLAEAAAL